ncbi:MAG: hypothetical protein HRT68_04345 [Flavobacteriaceae bacterium]|nr:hypothetical protein [Flavobacteriaceae bacterium]
MNQVYCGCGLYHIYISILKAIDDKKNGRKALLVVINDRTKNIETLIEPLRSLDLFEEVLSVESYTLFKGLKKRLGIFKYFFGRAKAIKKEFEERNPQILEWDAFIANAEINLYHVVKSRAYFIIKYPNNNFRMMEEGTGTYVQTLSWSQRVLRKYLMNYPMLMGYDNNFSEVLVQFPDQIKSPILRKKAVELNLEELEVNMTEEEIQRVVSVFQESKSICTMTRRKRLFLHNL